MNLEYLFVRKPKRGFVVDGFTERSATPGDLLAALVTAGVLVPASDFDAAVGVQRYVTKWVQVKRPASRSTPT